MEIETCFTCPNCDTKTIHNCPDESIWIDYEDKNPISVIWQDGSNLLSREPKLVGTPWIDVETHQCTFRDSIIVKNETIFDLNLEKDKVICSEDIIDLDATIPGALR